VAQSRRTAPGDVVDAYLTARGVNEPVVYPPSLRTHPGLRYTEGLAFPAMLAVVSDIDGKPVNMHRTWVQGAAKAPVDEPRKMFPGELPDGSCIRLSEVQPCIGIAEGIETALAASHRFEMPVWSATNATMLRKWLPPEGVTEVVIFADNDANFTGQAAAFHLAHSLSRERRDCPPVRAEVHVPGMTLAPGFTGKDWADL
jgi:putative DNA primase/helicase